MAEGGTDGLHARVGISDPTRETKPERLDDNAAARLPKAESIFRVFREAQPGSQWFREHRDHGAQMSSQALAHLLEMRARRKKMLLLNVKHARIGAQIAVGIGHDFA